MPKLKTKGGAKKRFEVKKSGKVKHAKAYAKHKFTMGKTPASKRRNRGTSQPRHGMAEADGCEKGNQGTFPLRAIISPPET